MKVSIDGNTLTISDVEAVARKRALVTLSRRALSSMKKSRTLVEKLLRGKTPIYGVNTGFGALSEVRIKNEDIKELQLNLLRSHAAGVGEPLPRDVVRAAMLLRANTLAKGLSGVRPLVAEMLIKMLNRGVHPVIPSKGSVGASGDLAPLAHLALAMTGEGEAELNGKILPVRKALKKARITPLEPAAKEGLSLINGTQAMTAIAALLVRDAEMTLSVADICGAISVEGYKGTHRAFHKKIMDARPHAGQLIVARNLLSLLQESEIAESHKYCERVQDPYSLRCMPQVHGAARDALEHLSHRVEIEINSATDNPLVFADTGEILSGGNFHGQPIALALDFLAIALSTMAAISERRIEQLLNPALGGLPAFLTPEPGLNSGLMMAQVTASSLVNETALLASPSCVYSIPSSGNKEDHVSMGMNSALKACQILNSVQTVLAIESICAAQALEFHKPLKPGKGVYRVYKILRGHIPPLQRDREIYKDINCAKALISEGKLCNSVKNFL